MEGWGVGRTRGIGTDRLGLQASSPSSPLIPTPPLPFSVSPCLCGENAFRGNTMSADAILPKDDGYRGIWYWNQRSNDEYVYKYSGGFATYPQQHVPIAL